MAIAGILEVGSAQEGVGVRNQDFGIRQTRLRVKLCHSCVTMGCYFKISLSLRHLPGKVAVMSSF